MKSMKSVKAFLFCVAAILTVLFAIAVSKPYKTVSVGANSVYANANTNTVNNAEEVTAPYDNTASTENESSETTESITSSTAAESESAVTVSQKDTLSSQTPPSSTKNQEAQTTKALTVSSETAKQNLPQTQKETTTKQVVPTTASSSSDDPEQITVYYTKTGKRYHYENPCGKGTYYPTTLADAKSRGLTPCQKCVLH